MKKYKTILVGLEGKKNDNIIVEHISRIKDTMGIQKIYFVHIHKAWNTIDNFYAKRLVLTSEKKRKSIIQELEQSFPRLEELEYEILVKDGNPEVEIPRIVSEKGIDLLVVGRKPRPGMSHLLMQLTDMSNCSLLIVPKRMGMKDCHFAPLDFSGTSKHAIKMAYYFKRLGKKRQISYSSPNSRSLYSRSYKPHKGQNTTDYSKKIVPEDLIANCAIILEKRENLARKIISYSLNKGANLIMIGYKGTNQLASFLFGSIAIKLAEISYRLPVLIDKKRRVNTDTLEAFISV